jgi:hypothetical protein
VKQVVRFGGRREARSNRPSDAAPASICTFICGSRVAAQISQPRLQATTSASLARPACQFPVGRQTGLVGSRSKRGPSAGTA